MLTSYLNVTKLLLQNPASTIELYSDADLTTFLNIAREQLAGETECIRVYATLALTAGTQSYALSTATLPASVSGIIAIKQVSVQLATGAQYVATREFPFFQQYYLNQIVTTPGIPQVFSQYMYGQGGSLGGSAYVFPPPDQTYTLNLDTVCLPIPLVDDTTAEAIPSLWTDAVPFFAASRAYQAAQRVADAENMMKQYSDYVSRARKSVTPSVLAVTAPQVPDATQSNKLGLRTGTGG